MKIKTIRFCGIVFIIGMTLGGALFSALGFQTLEAPEGTDVKAIGMEFYWIVGVDINSQASYA
jgi:hypothetical protein